MTAPGWYNAQGDPPGTTRYWDGEQWVGDPVATPASPMSPGGMGYGSSGVARRELAQPGTRIGARIIDAIIGIVIFLAFLVPSLMDAFDELDALGPNPTGDEVQRVFEDAFSTGSGSLLIGVLLGFLWEFLWVAFAGATPGKLIFGLRVSDAATDATPPGLPKAALRALNRLIPMLGVVSVGLGNASSGIAGLIGLISLVMLFSDNQHRTVMDRIAGTIVTKK